MLCSYNKRVDEARLHTGNKKKTNNEWKVENRQHSRSSFGPVHQSTKTLLDKCIFALHIVRKRISSEHLF